VPKLQAISAHIKQQMSDRLSEHTRYIEQYGEDQPEIRHWQWSTPSQEPQP
jgi:xylulose-5-phosphate/fructose-6-phosphate phosphoketolase